MFYKTNNLEVMNAFNKFNDDRRALKDSADSFAKEYSAEAVILADSDSVFFGGLKFPRGTSLNNELWRRPDRKFGTSSLRSKPSKKEFQAEFNAELEKWNELKVKHFPRGTKVDKSSFYKTLGFDWGDLLFTSFHCFARNDYLYINTRISSVASFAEEILGSEYQKAQDEVQP